MSIHTKPDGRVFVVHYDAAGRQKWESVGRGPDAVREAKRRDLEIRLLKASGAGLTANQPPAGLTVQAVIQQYINARQTDLADKTRREILAFAARDILPACGNKNIRGIALIDWIAIQNGMIQRGASNRTINTYFRYFSTIMRWAAEMGIIGDNPFKNRRPLKEKKHKIELFSTNEFKRILEVAAPHLAWAIRVAYYTGVRPGKSELLSMRWSDFDFPGEKVRIRGTKTALSERWQYPGREFMAQAQAYYTHSRAQGETSDFVCTWHDQPISSLKTAWETAQRSAGITRPIRLYDIRHYYITHALASGAGVLDLAERVGHTDGTMILKVYSHIVDDLRSKEAFKIPVLQPAQV